MKIKIIYYLFAILGVLLITLGGCTKVNTPQKNTGFVVSQGYSPLIIVEVDSCEYLLGEWGYATVLTHKGNCKYCAKRNQKPL
jgi:hypothetical protein